MSSRLIAGRALRVLALVVASGCTSGAEPRPQLVVVLDTDLPVVDQLRTHPELSNDAAMDSVRIDILDENNHPFDFLDVTVADPLDWPVSFGVATGDKTKVRLRARLFRAQHASPGQLNGAQTLEPYPGSAVDRIIDVSLPASGITRIKVMLAGDCLGLTPSFANPPRSCVDAAHPNGASTDGIATPSDDAPAVSRVGTWAPAKEIPCSKPGTPSRICIPGGFSLLGEAGLKGLVDGVAIRVDSKPLRPARLSPFYLDETEVTVGAFDALRASAPNAVGGTLPAMKDATSISTKDCTWLGGKAGAEKLPLNCVVRETAAMFCAAQGGMLPSEAQWEHAARGRGERRLYPWGGDSPFDCCVAAIACTRVGVQPVGSHLAGTGRCNGIGDVSRDGVLDLGGSVREHTRDALAAYDDPCWSVAGILVDPVCTVSSGLAFTSRGASWDDGPAGGIAALRKTDLPAEMLPSLGFRCAYADGKP